MVVDLFVTLEEMYNGNFIEVSYHFTLTVRCRMQAFIRVINVCSIYVVSLGIAYLLSKQIIAKFYRLLERNGFLNLLKARENVIVDRR